jgi:hypothetical protein
LSASSWIDNLGFITEGKLAAIFIKPSLRVFQLVGHLLQANKFSGTIKHKQVFWHHHHRAINSIA